MDCLFCKIVSGDIPNKTVYEDDAVLAFYDIDPKAPVHILVIPKEHYCDIDEMPVEVLNHLMEVSKRLVIAIKKVYQPGGYSIMQNGGVFNDIGHFHLHIFPRYKNDGFGWTFLYKVFAHSEEVAERLRKLL